MSPAFPLLLAAACAEWFVTFRPFQVIAKLFDLEADKVQEALARTRSFSFRGKLESALAAPEQRPDLLVHQTHLARLEHQLALLAQQFERAEHGVEELKRRPSGYLPKEMLQAEQFANRLHQQTVRLLKEIQKTQILLEKCASQPPPSAHLKTIASNSNVAVEAAADPSRSPESESPEIDQHTSAVSKETQSSIDPESMSEPSPPHPPSEEEFLQCLVENRDRLKATPAKQRPALIQRLIEEHREKAKKRAA